MAAIGRIYNQAFDRSPAGTLAITNGLLSGVADIVAQSSQITLAYRDAHVSKPAISTSTPTRTASHTIVPSYDPTRTVRFIIFGTIMGPFLARWNYFLERRFPLRQDGAKAVTGAPVVQNVQNAMIKRAQNSGGRSGNVSLTALAKRVGMDQACMAPFGLFVFFSSMGIMEGRSLPAIRQRFADLYGPAIKANWTVWPLIQFVNFRFMPLAYRVPFQATCGVFWTLYISLLNSSEPAAAVQEEEKRPEVEKTREREQDGQRVTTVGERLGRGRKHTY